MKILSGSLESSILSPLGHGTIVVENAQAVRVQISDALRRVYVDCAIPVDGKVAFTARGTACNHFVTAFNIDGIEVESATFVLQAKTRMSCDNGKYAELAHRIEMLLQQDECLWHPIINNQQYFMLVCWGRDHVHTLKAQKYFQTDVKSGMEYWLETQEENGMLWDTIYRNQEEVPTWFGEALGDGYYRYDDGMKYIVRRIPVEADCEFLYTEGVWYTWKATGDDGWMAKQLPVLERALKYNNSDPTRWSEKFGLVRRSMCMDSWDFVNPLFCNGDHRCINPGDPQFLFHSDNSGLYSSYWRMAEMHDALGNAKRADELRSEGEELRQRANDKLFFETNYGHMIPEELPEEEFYAKVGDERKRMSLSTGYTINRKLPTHDMAVAIINEYQKRGKEKINESFAEWWTMDPPYQDDQWPVEGTGGSTYGEYMNGAICTIIAGEIARAAFEHGCEEYGTDILDRVWELSERDGGELYQAYKRLPENPVFPVANFQSIDISKHLNRGLENGAHPNVIAWTNEGDNDLRNLPVGKQKFGAIEFNVTDPKMNDGKSILYMQDNSTELPAGVIIDVPNLTGKSLYFLQTLPKPSSPHSVMAIYDVVYADNTTERIYVRMGDEVGHWWGPSGKNRKDNTRIAWRGPNPTWKDVGIYMNGWNNPHPEKPITAIQMVTVPGKAIILAAISVSDRPVEFETKIRSHGLPDSWAQAAVYYAIAEGLAGIEDTGKAFDQVKISPRWSASIANEADITLHYPASGGYCSYKYNNTGDEIILDVTGSFKTAQIHCLLPADFTSNQVKVDGKKIDFKVTQIEQSNYVDFTLNGIPGGEIVIM